MHDHGESFERTNTNIGFALFGLFLLLLGLAFAVAFIYLAVF
jgi:hypothetical protein